MRTRRIEPPTWLIYAGYLGLLAEVAGRWLGGRWGQTVTQVGLTTVAGGALVFFSRLFAWLASRR